MTAGQHNSLRADLFLQWASPFSGASWLLRSAGRQAMIALTRNLEIWNFKKSRKWKVGKTTIWVCFGGVWHHASFKLFQTQFKDIFVLEFVIHLLRKKRTHCSVSKSSGWQEPAEARSHPCGSEPTKAHQSLYSKTTHPMYVYS